jgi:hypothetical protein
VAIVEYHIAAGPQTRDLALADALQAWRLVKANPAALGVHGGRFGIMGYSAGGHLAARTTQALGADEQPDEVILIYPAYLQEPRPGTVIPAVTPPAQPKGRLFALIAGNDNKDWVRSCSEYAKTWKGYDGAAVLHVLADGGHGFGMRAQRTGAAQGWPDLLKAFLADPPQPPAGPNPAAVPVPQRGMEKRHAEKVAAARAKKYDVLLVGDSITHNLETPAFQEVWKKYFAPRNALNLGYSGARTENILWNLLNGELDGQSPQGGDADDRHQQHRREELSDATHRGPAGRRHRGHREAAAREAARREDRAHPHLPRLLRRPQAHLAPGHPGPRVRDRSRGWLTGSTWSTAM